MNFLLFINPWLLIIINKSIYAMRGIDGWIYKNFALDIGSAGFYQTSVCVITVPHLNLVILVLVFSHIHNILSERKVDNGEVNPLQFSTVPQSCLTLCDPMDCSMPDFPVHHQLPEFTETHAIQPSYPLSLPSPPAFDLSQHQGLLQ